ALRGINLKIHAGEYLAICGTSGSGKSTLLQIIGGLDRPTRGIYRYCGRPLESLHDAELARLRNQEFGFVFQTFQLLADRSAEENVRLPLDYRRGGKTPHEPRRMLERVGLGARLKHRPGELSGGEQQRVAIARALVKRPRLILFDELTGNLDQKTGKEILDLLDELHAEEHATLLLVTHDENVARRASRVLILEDGQWCPEAETG
ncbi:MAG: ABC transporter ATP-binding protein, partial [Planctomycetota bacterium]